jgi:Toprim-like
MRVEFSEVRKVPIASVLSHYRIPFRKRSDTELVSDCPLPSHAESSHKGTFAVSIEKGKFYCHSDKCRAASNKPKGGDIIDLVCMLENCLPLDAAKRIKEMFSITGVPDNPPSKPFTNAPLMWKHEDLDPDHPAIRERGLSLETVMEFGVGFHYGKGIMANRICFPLFENGSLIGYAGRATDGTEPRWRLPNGLVKSFFYGLEKCDPTKPLHIVEGFWAVLFLFQHNIQSAALMGCTMTEAQEQCLEPYAEIRVALDNDAAGIEAAAKIVERLKTRHKVSKAFLRK